MKRVMAFMLVGVLSISMLAGCGKKAEETVTLAETPTDNFAEAMPVNNTGDDGRVEFGATPEKPEEEFDGSIYADMDWNMGDLGSSIQMIVNGYYGTLDMSGSQDGMIMSFTYNMEHLLEIGSEPVSENAGNKVILYMTNDGNAYYFNDTEDKDNPKMLCFEGTVEDTTEDTTEETSTDSVSEEMDSLSMKSMFGDDIAFVEYKRLDQESGRDVDICSVTLNNVNTPGEEILCDAYIDRETKTLQKLVKIKDKENKFDYDLTIQALEDGVVDKPEWADQCTVASEEESFEIFSAMLGMMVIMSTDDLSTGEGLSLDFSLDDMTPIGEELGEVVVIDAVGNKQTVIAYKVSEESAQCSVNCVSYKDKTSLKAGDTVSESDLEYSELFLSTTIDGTKDNADILKDLAFDATTHYFEIKDVEGQILAEDPFFSTVDKDDFK